MKFNWGTGLAIGMIAFISFIMYFVITMLTSPGFDHDLVVEDYYGAELHYQQDINAESNALELEDKLTFTRKGKFSFYKPTARDRAFKIRRKPLYVSTVQQSIRFSSFFKRSSRS